MRCLNTEYLTDFLILSNVLWGTVCFGTLPLFTEETSMLICRGIACFGALLFVICALILLYEMFCTVRTADRNTKYHVSTSIKLFQFIMTIISMSGYFMRIPYGYILHEFDFALNYSYFLPMAITDGIYVLSILFYLPIQLLYLWFFVPHTGFFENETKWYKKYKYIFGFILIVNFWQKWLFETLVTREEICEELFFHDPDRDCIGHRHYHTNITSMSYGELEAYYLMKKVSPLSYSCTMELLVVYLVVLCYCKKQHQQRKVFQHTFHLPIGSNWFIVIILFTVFLMAVALFGALACLTFKLIISFDDEEHPRHIEELIYNYIKLPYVSVELFVFIILCKIYENVKAKKPRKKRQNSSVSVNGGEGEVENNGTNVQSENNSSNNDDEVGCCCVFGKFNCCFLCSCTNEPDILILQITWWTSVFLFGINTVFRLIGFIHEDSGKLETFLYHMLPTGISLISFAYNFSLLRRFLLTDSDSYNELSRNRFTTRVVAPYQVIRSFLRAISHFVEILDPQVSMHYYAKIDQWFSLFNAVYPFTPLINITSALCWAHVIENFFAQGSYDFFNNNNTNTVEGAADGEYINDEQDDNVDHNDEEQLLIP